jgi:hypothetical protein
LLRWWTRRARPEGAGRSSTGPKRSTKLRRSTWVNKAPKSLINVVLVEASEAAQKPGELFYLRTLFPATTEGTSHIHYWPSYGQYRMLTQMYHHQAQKE